MKDYQMQDAAEAASLGQPRYGRSTVSSPGHKFCPKQPNDYLSRIPSDL